MCTSPNSCHTPHLESMRAVLSLCFADGSFGTPQMESMRVVLSLCFLICIVVMTFSCNGCATFSFGINDTGLRPQSSGYMAIPSIDFCIQFFLLHLASLLYLFRLLRVAFRGFCRPRCRLGKRSFKRLTRCAPQVLRRNIAREHETERLTHVIVRIFPYL